MASRERETNTYLDCGNCGHTIVVTDGIIKFGDMLLYCSDCGTYNKVP